MGTQAVVIGEALTDIIERPGQMDEEHPGGSPMNVAIGLGRLGHPVLLGTWIGRDPRGQEIAAHCAASQVKLLPGSDQAERTSTALAQVDADGHAEYTFDLLWQVPSIPARLGPLVAHVGSMSAVLEPGADEIAALLSRASANATICYDPNVRPDIMRAPESVRARIERLIGLADVVKVSTEDIAWLYPQRSEAESCADWLGRGPAVLILTRGGDGATGWTAGASVDVPAGSSRVADTVGAGDSFMSGFIHALWGADLLGAQRREALKQIPKPTLHELLSTAAKIAEITCSRPGADPPWLSELS